MAGRSSARKVRDEDSNPCIEESDGSQRCMDAHGYEKSRCSAYFMRYKNCRKYWHTVMLQRRRDGVKPDMPNAEERDQILSALGGKPY
ncbi:coiled-coil-helix-coiled-coil-helix domain-containing protein 7 [Rhinichthys klamathensis goyatoka]|uniref:coiled-coil-helix-coiled-coil-helix domain-containing protein 7 n=1 Tax=Rhinichthys klamathensis goyatoka TaxID=3034132 RepID=UPI0024B4D5AF|nr:coiled-coil-helix-coiled-coil-helix domain-containing protein 7 [Rhinichthys klamathensis goyatoka]XP_056128329.1 coiled-coil-helix-coiled-coil-helix domain-containing protein 7 [Rhinichthys klamathensis goyatoka]XP_056128330.1 coiled-coil-helix-coiled-coil-helix domain-containing protein 7 [Rhinichthys klamathensis goyatoka]